MFEQTKHFLALRQPHVDVPLEVISVQQIGGGVANDCSNNAMDVAESRPQVRPVTGWLVCSSPNVSRYSVIQHWWNADKNGKHFDTTPSDGSLVEYVVDLSLYRFAHKHYDEINSIVASSLQIDGDSITAVDSDLERGGERTYRAISSLDNHSLYNLVKK